jgi:hypothetical protein
MSQRCVLKESCHPDPERSEGEGSDFLISRICGRCGEKADPSTPFGANAPNSAQDDIIMVVLYVNTTYAKQG